MPDPRTLLLLAGSPSGGEQGPLPGFILMGLIFAIFYFVLILPMKQKQKKLDEMVKTLKAGDRVILSSGIYGTIVAVEDDAFALRIDQTTKIKILKSAVAGLQDQPVTEKK
ncbi:MAG TPA: preprotein translocase subunit YajC [Vicinamibacteria bacterium]|jgi:preprotein translocase subunit YajC|nr:preprotein translocase subunit YajC [Vicinamibacteria bacterium]